MTETTSDDRLDDSSAKAAHVNMMTDTIIANLPIEGLRGVLRGLLGTDTKTTCNFHTLATKYLRATRPKEIPELFNHDTGFLSPSAEFYRYQGRYRCLMGCGFGFESAADLTEVIGQVSKSNRSLAQSGDQTFAGLDGDIVQVVTAIQKELITGAGLRLLSEAEKTIVDALRHVLVTYRDSCARGRDDYVFARGLSRLEREFHGGHSDDGSNRHRNMVRCNGSASKRILETVRLGDVHVPRMFMGLWQFSSPAWGTASQAKINAHFKKHVDAGFLAYDMADHYGDAEVTFGQFRSSQPEDNEIFCATKLCIFTPTEVTPELISATISERVANVDAEKIELLQFHWQDYADDQYIKAARLIADDPRVDNLGLCNFDTKHMEKVIEAGIPIVSNQVQFSLIDLRPTFSMSESCKKHNVKLLTYGSLCGGFLADKWSGKPAPNLFDENMTPSHRKYLEMIQAWGDWPLFQRLLMTLSTISTKHGVSLSSVAIRWVLEHEHVGAVIIGARMGTSEHVDDNLRVFSFALDEADKAVLADVLAASRARRVFEEMGDCGAEYRQ